MLEYLTLVGLLLLAVTCSPKVCCMHVYVSFCSILTQAYVLFLRSRDYLSCKTNLKIIMFCSKLHRMSMSV